MFISQNNNMGRVNILFQLLPKMNIKHPSRYLKKICAKSLLQEGSIKFNLLAILSMFSNSGKISIHELLSFLLNPMDKPRRSLLKDSSFVLNETYGFTLLSDLLKGTPLHLRNDRFISTVLENDIPWYNIALLTRITKIKNDLGSVEEILERLTNSLIEELIPNHFTLKDKGLFFNFYNWVLSEISGL